MHDPRDNPPRELAWRQKLTPDEEAQVRAWLAAHPEAQADWELEAGLTEALGHLPDVPVASNFTARVLEAAEREKAGTRRALAAGGWTRIWRLHLWPKAAFVAVFALAGLLTYEGFRSAERAQYRQSLTAISEVSSLASPQALQDFEAVQALRPTSHADEDLLSLMQ